MESINTRKRVLVSLCPLDTYTHRPWLVIQKSRSSSISHLKKMMIPDVGWTLWGFGWLIALWRPSPFVFGRRRWCLFLFVCQAFFFILGCETNVIVYSSQPWKAQFFFLVSEILPSCRPSFEKKRKRISKFFVIIDCKVVNSWLSLFFFVLKKKSHPKTL